MENNIILQVGVKIILKNKDGKYLLLRRSVDKYPEVEGRWDIVGGRIEPGKTLIENLKREVMEETGLELENEPKLITSQDILRNAGQHVVRLTYLGEADGEIKLDDAENDAYKWYSWEELAELDSINSYFKELFNDKLLWNRHE